MKQLFTLSFLLIISINLFAQNVGIGNTNPQAALDLQGDLRLHSAVLALPNGLNNDVDLTTVKSSVYMLAGAALGVGGPLITGFTGGVDGRIITIFNNSTLGSIQLYDAGFSVSPSAAANKILTGTGNNAIILSNGSVTLRYDGAKQKWVIVSSNYTNGLTNEFWKLSGVAGDEIKTTNVGGFWSESPTLLGETSNDITNPPTVPTTGAGTRMMWIPSRSAFRVGTVQNTFGLDGSAYWNANNVGLFSFATGFNTLASGRNSTAMGINTKATSTNATSIGVGAIASGFSSMAIGYSAIASGEQSLAMGSLTQSVGAYSTSMGYNTYASGIFSTAMGNISQAVGSSSTSMGYNTYAPGDFSTAMGHTSQAFGNSSTAMGFNTYTNSDFSTVIGRYNQVNSQALFMVGNGTSNTNRYNTFTIRKDNNCVGINNDNPQAALHVSGYQNVSGGQASFFYPASEYNNLNTYYYNTSRHIYSLTDAPTFTASLSILSDYGIMSKTYIGSGVNIVSSDSRIKNIIGISNNKEDLERLKKIQITNYKMKDVNTWGNQVFKKVIAQQIEEVYPEVIKKTKSTIPDIYALAQTVSYNEKNKELTITLSKSYDIKIGDKIELVHPINGKQVAEVISVTGNSFTVKDWVHPTDKIFVFGREVNDFRNVDYEALSMLGISAIQQLAKEVEELKKENKKLATDFESRLAALELILKPTIVVNK
jgi:hypothetical protein